MAGIQCKAEACLDAAVAVGIRACEQTQRGDFNEREQNALADAADNFQKTVITIVSNSTGGVRADTA